MGDSVGLIMRVAASVLVVVAMAYVVMQVAARKGEGGSSSAVFMASKKATPLAATTTQIAEAKPNEIESLPEQPPVVPRRSRGTIIETSKGLSDSCTVRLRKKRSLQPQYKHQRGVP